MHYIKLVGCRNIRGQANENKKWQGLSKWYVSISILEPRPMTAFEDKLQNENSTKCVCPIIANAHCHYHFAPPMLFGQKSNLQVISHCSLFLRFLNMSMACLQIMGYDKQKNKKASYSW